MGIRPWKRLVWQRAIGRGGSFSRRSGNPFWRGDAWTEIWFFVMKTQLPWRTILGMGWGGWTNAKHGFDCACSVWVCKTGWWSGEWGHSLNGVEGLGWTGSDQTWEKESGFLQQGVSEELSAREGCGQTHDFDWVCWLCCAKWAGERQRRACKCLSEGCCRVEGTASSYSEPEQGR